MYTHLGFICVLSILPFSYQVTSTGAIELDDLSFDKITSKFQASLIKFDVAFPYGDKHDAFTALAKDTKDVDDLLVAQVGVKDYGEKENEELAKKYGASKDNFPIVLLFVKNKKEPIQFDDSNGFTTEILRKFVRDQTGLYLSLPGCVKELDKLTVRFMTQTEKRDQVLKEVTVALNKLSEKDTSSGKIYKTIMTKIIEKGNEFVKIESDRVKKLITGKLSEEKKKELAIRLNILQSFTLHEKHGKEEL